ncbi:MAG: LysR family transcriptional regulator [Ruminococcus sp.]|uniref:LysR family transcriptional regulator n=1 Tax=Ruminococcus sp. TaxID=41978 RepID=UPI0025CDEA34|nr:LysR family transcriptional regulator [Ruminococcus sp.]MBR6996626.1 LysR family transcriptional regulator [Ruminococcus sp.]
MEMNISKYLAFVKTIEYGSFTKAAEMLNYSQSGISRMINDLENDWKITLLERGKSGVRLTSDGTRILPYVRSVCEEYDKLCMQVDELNGLQSGLIRIGTFSSVATHWLPGIIKRFQESYPNIEYELLLGDYSEIEAWIAEGRVDCGFLRLPTQHEFETISLKHDPLLAVIPESHPLAEQKEFPITAFDGQPFMMLEKGGNYEITELFERNGIHPDVRFTTWDDYAVMSMVEQGLGIAILPELILQRIPYHILTKPIDVPAYREIGLAYRSRRSLSLAAERFVACCEECL